MFEFCFYARHSPIHASPQAQTVAQESAARLLQLHWHHHQYIRALRKKVALDDSDVDGSRDKMKRYAQK